MEADYFIQEYEELLKNKLTEAHQKQLKISKEKGEEDGKRNLPSVDDNFATPVEFEIRSKYQAEIETLYQNGKQVLNDLEEKGFKAINQELVELKEEKIHVITSYSIHYTKLYDLHLQYVLQRMCVLCISGYQ